MTRLDKGKRHVDQLDGVDLKYQNSLFFRNPNEEITLHQSAYRHFDSLAQYSSGSGL
jgi:hypothetical protein